MKIQEIIVVEGKHDSDRLHQYFDCDTIETGGLSLDEGKLEMIKQAQEKEALSSLPIRIRRGKRSA